MTFVSSDLKDLIPLIHTYNGNSLPPKPNKIVHPWKPEEDELLLHAVEEFGMKRWHLVAQRIPNRTRKQCRERYCNHLDPEITKIPWTEKEDEILKEAKLLYGNRWTMIKSKLPGRTANQVKNRYFAKFSDLEKKLNESESQIQLNTQSVEKTPRIGSLNDQKKKESNKKVEKKVEKRTIQKEKKDLSVFIPVDQKLFVISLGGSLID